MIAQKLIVEAEASTINARKVPLLKAELSRFDDRDSVLFLTVHHSVSDAWSLQVILRDLGAFYAARRTGVPVSLPPVRQYREYAEWQRANASSSDLAIRAFTAGRDEPQFQDTMGLFLNVVPFRTHLDGCTSFRDIVTRAMGTSSTP